MDKRIRAYLILFVIVVFGTVRGQAQDIDPVYSGIRDMTWQKLFRIDYEIIEDYDEFGDLTVPVFSEEVKVLEGKEIVLTGYIFPFENAISSTHLMFTALPVNACFFCGVGGPESVVEVFMTEQVDYTQGKISISGELELNDANPEQMMYILNNGKIIE